MDQQIDVIINKTNSMIETGVSLLPNLLIGTIVFGVFCLIAKLARIGIQKVFTHTHQRQGLGIIIGRLVFGIFIFLGGLVSLSVITPSFKISDLIELLGIGTVAIGFAFKDILQNFLAGILILFSEPFKLGDQIIASGYE
ncbi:MAG: mechanosensitive ion channel, partial [Proteobacteria bacterium]